MVNSGDTGTPVSRQQIFEAINSEREYQLRRWGTRQADGSLVEVGHGVCDFLVYMQDYLTAAFNEASRKAGNEAVLEQLRKVVTIGVACFEQHGVRARDKATIINGRDGKPA